MLRKLLAFTIVFMSLTAHAAESLILEYKFTTDSGKVVVDSSGNEMDGTILGSGTYHFGTGFSGRGLKLNGVDNHVLVPDNPIFDLHRYTLMAWVKFRPNKWDREEVMEKAGAFWMNIRQNTRRVRVGGFYGGCANDMYYFKLDSTQPVPINTWTHVAASYDGTTLRIFINGILSGKSAVPVPGPVCVNIEPLSIGSKHRIISPPEDAAFFLGTMDSIRIFEGVLPAWRIKQEMQK